MEPCARNRPILGPEVPEGSSSLPMPQICSPWDGNIGLYQYQNRASTLDRPQASPNPGISLEIHSFSKPGMAFGSALYDTIPRRSINKAVAMADSTATIITVTYNKFSTLYRENRGIIYIPSFFVTAKLRSRDVTEFTFLHKVSFEVVHSNPPISCEDR